MPDYGHDLEFGYFLVPDAEDPEGVIETAVLADRLGYDLLAVQDHPYQRRHLERWHLGVILAAGARTPSASAPPCTRKRRRRSTC